MIKCIHLEEKISSFYGKQMRYQIITMVTLESGLFYILKYSPFS